jgi:hypothetical protein
LTSFSNEFDVTRNVRTTDPAAVSREVVRVFLGLYPDASPRLLDQVFSDVTRLFAGAFPGLRACDTAYHDLQHTMDVTLAMARLLDGYERARTAGMISFDAEMFQLGVVAALFHDIGYLREEGDARARNGAEYTLTHVSRGARFLRGYLPGVGLGHLREVAGSLIHFTGYEIPIGNIAVPDPKFRVLGNLLGSADIISQMSDRCYLEKCRDRLYPEFVAGGIARWRDAHGREQVLYASGEDLVMKTPGFYYRATRRLEEELAGSYRVAEHHFGGQNLYLEELDKNIRFAREVTASGDLSALRRVPPSTLLEEAQPTAAPPSTTPSA